MTRQAGLERPLYGMGATVGDYDSDGWPDLFISGYKGSRLYRNRGDGSFEDVTERAGLFLSDRWAIGSSFLDFDLDGRLDLFVACYLEYDPDYSYHYAADRYPGPLAYRPQSDLLFRNKGDGTFEDVSRRTGISLSAGRSMGVAVADFNDDRFPDIFVANDAGANFLYVNRDGKVFMEMGIPMGVAFGQGREGTASMGPDWADVDGDGHLDLFVPDDKYGSLYLYRPAANRFVDGAAMSGIAPVAAQFIGWGSGAYDFDNDGEPDIYQVNGDLNLLQPQEDLLLRGIGQGRFEDASLDCGAWFSTKFVGRGASFADFDRDGDVDVALATLNGPGLLLKNEGVTTNHWLRLDLVSRENPDPIGAKLWIRAGGTRRVYQVRGGSGYLSQSERTVHVGLGPSGAPVEVEVVWPSGLREVFTNVTPDRVVELEEGEGEVKE